MLALKEFANFVTINTASLAATYARLLVEIGEGYDAFSAHSRQASARKLLKAVSEACELESAAPLCHLFEDWTQSQQPAVPDQEPSSPRWTENIVPPQPLLELETLGQTLMPVVTSLEAGKFLWQILSEVRSVLLNQPIAGRPAPSPWVSPEQTEAVQILSVESDQLSSELSELATLFYKASSSAMMILDQSGFINCNEAALKLFGHPSREDILNTHPSEQSPPTQSNGQDSRVAADEMIAAVIQKGTHRFEWLHRRVDGTIFPAEVLLTAIMVDEKPVIQAVIRDITDRKQVEDRLAKRATELQGVAAITTAATGILDFQDLLQNSVDLTKEKFDLLHAQIYLLDETENRLVLAAGAGEAGQRLVAQGWSIALQQEQSLVVRAARTRQGVIFNDIQDSSGWQSDSLLPEARAQMAIPMIAGDKVMGVLDVQADVTGRFTQEDVHIKTVLATQMAAALQNADLFSRMQEALNESQQSHELLRSVIDATPDWIFIKDREHRYRLVNQGYANSLQLRPEDFIGKNDLELGFPEDIVKGNPDKGIRGFWPDDREVMEAGEPKFIESEPAVIDDQPVFLSTIKVPLRDAGENVWGVLGFVRDITERERVLEEMETLFQASAGLNTSQSYEDILSVLRQYTVVGQDAQNVSLNYFDRPFTDEQQPEWVNVLSRWSELPSEAVMARYPTAAYPAITQVLRPDVPILVEDVSGDPRLDDSSRELYVNRFGASSTIFAPLVVGGQWIGYINAIYQQPTTFPEPEVRRLMTIAGQAAVAVQNLRNIVLAEARAIQLEQLTRLEAALSQAITEEEILGALAHNLEVDRPDRLILQYLATDDQDQPLYTETVAVWEGSEIQEDDPDLHQRYPVEQFPLSQFWLEAPDELLLISDVQSDPRIDEALRDMLTRLGVAAFANLPLRSGSRWQGLVALDWAEPRTFSEEEQALYRQLLEPVAAVVASRRAYIAQEAARNESERVARREQTIRQITEKMRAATTLEQLIQTAAEELGQRFSADYALVELGTEDSDNKVLESQG